MNNFNYFSLSAILLAVAASLFQYLVVYQRWNSVNMLDRNDWKAANWKVYQDSDIETVYYEVGKLGEVLKEWKHGKFILYRLKEGEQKKYSFDAEKELQSDVVVRKLDTQCENTECTRFSTLALNCLFDYSMQNGHEEVVDAQMLLTEKGSGYSASFAQFTNKNTINNLWNLLNVPFSPNGWLASFEQAFISNLKEPRITAAFHANPVTDSVAIQYEGKKTWLFLPAPTYVTLMKSTFAGSALWPKRSPKKEDKPEVYIYTSQPGDVLFFPEAWGHTVYTHPGRNVMFNFRQMYYGNFLRQPIIFTSTVIESVIGGYRRSKTRTQRDENIQKLQKTTPLRNEHVRIQRMHQSMCGEEGNNRTEFDEQMLALLRSEVERVTGSPFQEMQLQM